MWGDAELVTGSNSAEPPDGVVSGMFATGGHDLAVTTVLDVLELLGFSTAVSWLQSSVDVLPLPCILTTLVGGANAGRVFRGGSVTSNETVHSVADPVSLLDSHARRSRSLDPKG